MTDIIAHASEADVPAIADLVNRSYRPTSDDAGWTHEAALVAGPRTSTDQVQALFQDGSVVLIMKRDNALIACVHVLNEGDACCIGMLATEPKLQGHGVGKAMLEAAGRLAVQAFQARVLRMSVLSNRPELQAFYERRGFRLTDLTQPYPEDAGVGSPMRSNLLVRSMVKHLSPIYG
jgi:N-acetylglutamate synthase-like GNAT family acetyltransferase